MKLLSFFLIFAFSLLSFEVFAENCTYNPSDSTSNAVDFLNGCSQGTPGVPPGAVEGKQAIKERVKTVAKGAISLGALLAVGAIVWSGIRYTTAYGNDESIKKAKTTAVYALIGLILLLLSFALVNIFVNFVYTLAGQG